MSMPMDVPSDSMSFTISTFHPIEVFYFTTFSDINLCQCLDYAGFIVYTFSLLLFKNALMWKLFSPLFNEVVNFVSLYLLQVTFQTKPCPQQAPCPGSRASSAMPTIRASDTQPLGNLQESLGTSMIPCELLPTAENFKITELSALMWPIICNIRDRVQLGTNSAFFFRLSRLFSDAKKILLYSQNDNSLDGFKELISAVKAMQNNTAGEYGTAA